MGQAGFSPALDALAIGGLGQSLIVWRAIAHLTRIQRATPYHGPQSGPVKLNETTLFCAAERNAPVVSFGHCHLRLAYPVWIRGRKSLANIVCVLDMEHRHH